MATEHQCIGLGCWMCDQIHFAPDPSGIIFETSADQSFHISNELSNYISVGSTITTNYILPIVDLPVQPQSFIETPFVTLSQSWDKQNTAKRDAERKKKWENYWGDKILWKDAVSNLKDLPNCISLTCKQKASIIRPSLVSSGTVGFCVKHDPRTTYKLFQSDEEEVPAPVLNMHSFARLTDIVELSNRDNNELCYGIITNITYLDKPKELTVSTHKFSYYYWRINRLVRTGSQLYWDMYDHCLPTKPTKNSDVMQKILKNLFTKAELTKIDRPHRGTQLNSRFGQITNRNIGL